MKGATMNHIVSGIQPTGELNIGTYLGSIHNFVALQKEFKDDRFFLFVADVHALTVKHDPAQLKKSIRSLAAMYIACGLNIEQTCLFIQSEVDQHFILDVLLQSYGYIGELERMTQFKEKSQLQKEGIRASLFTYPVLMAADILLYDAKYVPVGIDQKQHLELTRTIAERVNHSFPDTFTVPEPLMAKVGAKIMSLQDPTKKMSKSDPNVKSKILLTDPPHIIEKRISSAVTDSEGIIRFDGDNKPGLSNLITMFAALENTSEELIVKQYQSASYQDFKKALSQKVISVLTPIQEKYQALQSDTSLDQILENGRLEASSLAQKKVLAFKRKLGLGNLKSRR
jgi:tryptophanyl-tRNA synthetase